MVAALLEAATPARARARGGRAISWRADTARARAVQMTLTGALTWIATADQLVLPWLTVSVGLCAVDCWASRWALGRPLTARVRGLAAAGHFLAAASFCAVVVLLLRAPSPMHVATAVLVLCAIALNNAMMARGSRLALAAGVSPAALLLIATPALARVFGRPMSMADVGLMAVAGGVFVAFIVRLAVTFHAEGETLADALEAAKGHAAIAEAAEQTAVRDRRRWQMIFEDSPLARICFDASDLYAILTQGAPIGAGLGDRLAALCDEPPDMQPHIRLMEANPEAVALCGLGPERGLDASRFDRRFVSGFAWALNRIGEDGVMPVFEAEVRGIDGTVRDLEVHCRMTSAGGPPWSLGLATFVDVTGARNAAREQLEALKTAEVANRAKSDFLAVISHELRTPLNGVLGMAQAMAGGRLEPAQRERLEVIGKSGSDLLTIVDDLLDLSRIEAGQLELTCADFDLRAVLRRVSARHAEAAAAKGLTFSIEPPAPALARCRGDAARVGQVLDALLSNAVKFTDRGEIVLAVGPGSRGLRCEVRDTGVGIPADRLDKLFEPFGQADSSMTRAYGGVGLGLAICRRVCRAMGGEIAVRSRPGAGSAFTVDLPIVRPAGTRKPARRKASKPALTERGIRVLAAEDNPVNQRVLTALLAQVGVVPTLVGNGREAVAAWEGGDWDLILMDMQMPVMDGQTATCEIRAREARLGRAPIPIIAVTANAMRHQIDGYRAAGITQVVSKPIEVEQLFTAMVAAVAQAEETPRAKAS